MGHAATYEPREAISTATVDRPLPSPSRPAPPRAAGRPRPHPRPSRSQHQALARRSARGRPLAGGARRDRHRAAGDLRAQRQRRPARRPDPQLRRRRHRDPARRSPSCCAPSAPSGYAGFFVVLAIFVSACVAGVEAVSRLIDPEDPTDLLGARRRRTDRLRRQLDRGRHPHPRRQPTGQPGADRGRQPRPRRLLRQPRRDRQRVVVASALPIADPLIGLGDHRRHHQDHLGLLADRAPGHPPV